VKEEVKVEEDNLVVNKEDNKEVKDNKEIDLKEVDSEIDKKVMNGNQLLN
jgi:hypothetical protein